jgi:predicted transcriptional regulator
VYQPAEEPDAVQHSLLQRLMEKVFQGSPSALVQTLVQREDLSDDEREEIKALISDLDEQDSDSDDATGA